MAAKPLALLPPPRATLCAALPLVSSSRIPTQVAPPSCLHHGCEQPLARQIPARSQPNRATWTGSEEVGAAPHTRP